jgi:hypothetical protein
VEQRTRTGGADVTHRHFPLTIDERLARCPST